jgi:hypothetical protein
MIGAKQASEMSGLRLSLGLEASFLQCLTRKAGLTLSCGTRPVGGKITPPFTTTASTGIGWFILHRSSIPQFESAARVQSSNPRDY